MTDRAKVQVVLPSVTGLPADVFINTFHFVTSVNSDAIGVIIASRLVDFYNGAGPSHDLAWYLGNTVSRVTGAAQIKCYDELDNSLPPFYETTFTIDASGQVGDLPWEVACCLSFKNLTVTTVPERNRRGRIYLGPLNVDTVTEVGGSIRPHVDFIGDLLDAGQRLYDANDASALWTVYSRVQAEGYLVEAGWVDNAFDTQRRRGEAATSRTSITF